MRRAILARTIKRHDISIRKRNTKICRAENPNPPPLRASGDKPERATCSGDRSPPNKKLPPLPNGLAGNAKK